MRNGTTKMLIEQKEAYINILISTSQRGVPMDYEAAEEHVFMQEIKSSTGIYQCPSIRFLTRADWNCYESKQGN